MRKINIAGLFLCAGNIQFFLMMTIAESLYPGYSVSSNYISDLGVGPTGLLFNISIVLLGVCTLIAAILLYHASSLRLFNAALGLTGVAAIGVGLLPENLGVFHVIAAAATFFIGALAAICAYPVTRPPFSYAGVLLGILSLVCFFLFAVSIFAGIGPGGMERMIAYPVLLWAVAFGGYLAAYFEYPDADFLHRFS
jgi:hypothetical membrane protein